jgi:hypothetical protein
MDDWKCTSTPCTIQIPITFWYKDQSITYLNQYFHSNHTSNPQPEQNHHRLLKPILLNQPTCPPQTTKPPGSSKPTPPSKSAPPQCQPQAPAKSSLRTPPSPSTRRLAPARQRDLRAAVPSDHRLRRCGRSPRSRRGRRAVQERRSCDRVCSRIKAQW